MVTSLNMTSVPSKTVRTWELSILALDVVLKVYFEPLAKRRRIASKLHAMITSDFGGTDLIARQIYYLSMASFADVELLSDLGDFALVLLGGLHVDHEGSGCLYDIPLWSHGWDSYYQHAYRYHALVDMRLPTTDQMAQRTGAMAALSRRRSC